jgi:hypothetical protein
MKIKFTDNKPIVALFYKADDELHSIYNANEFGANDELEFSATIFYTVKGATVDVVLEGRKANRCNQDGILPAEWQEKVGARKDV